MVWESWIAIYKATETHPLTKINKKWLEDLDIRHDTIDFIERNRGKTFSHKSYQYFLRSVSQDNRNKTKTNKWNLGNLPNFCIEKETINKIKRLSMY